MKAMIIVNTDQASLLRDNTGNVHALNTSHLPRYVYVSSIRKFLSTDCVIDYDKTFQVMTVDNYLNICKLIMQSTTCPIMTFQHIAIITQLVTWNKLEDLQLFNFYMFEDSPKAPDSVFTKHN